jgi:hypothetical protein
LRATPPGDGDGGDQSEGAQCGPARTSHDGARRIERRGASFRPASCNFGIAFAASDEIAWAGKAMTTSEQAILSGGDGDTYSDGSAHDRVQFFDAKLILKPDFFGSVRGFRQFSDLVAEAIGKVKGVHYAPFDLTNLRPRIREVAFFDTPDNRLYNSSLIVRRRTIYQDGFPVSDPEVVLKFRNSDKGMVAAVDVRPSTIDRYRVKLKAEALPLKDEAGGYRLLYSHNCIASLSSVHEADRRGLSTLRHVIPAVKQILPTEEERLAIVSSTLIEEVLMDLGTIDFGKDNVTKANISLWRSLGDHSVMCGEFAYQAKFDSADAISAKVKERVEDAFIQLQLVAKDWLLFGVTKTALVYRLKGNPPQAHE